MLIATILTAPGRPTLSPRAMADLARRIGGDGVRVLSPGAAFETALVVAPGPAVGDALRAEGMDLAVQPAGDRRRRILLADMDSTMIGQECIDELAAEAGVGDRVAAITERAMKGELDFEAALVERVGLLAGLPATAIARVLAARITMAPGGATLVATMAANGAYAALVSGGFTAFAGPVAARLGFAEHRANRLEVADGRLTGRVLPPILGRQAKVDALHAIAAGRGLSAADVIAVGDGANDLGMLGAAGTGVALHAKPAVAAAAPIRIDHGDLTALLFLQGHAAADFVTA